MARDCHKLKGAKSESSSLKGHLSESETDYYFNFQDAKLLTSENWHHFSSLCSGRDEGDKSAELDSVMSEEEADSDEIVFLLWKNSLFFKACQRLKIRCQWLKTLKDAHAGQDFLIEDKMILSMIKMIKILWFICWYVSLLWYDNW